VEGFLHLQVGIISLPNSRREIDGYKVPSSAYITNFLQVLYESKKHYVCQKKCNGKNVPLHEKAKL
jgi:hypothetical protein